MSRLSSASSDAINPQHYKLGDVQPVDIAEHLSFNLGNVVKYVSRAGRKGDALEDLKKASWYLNREIARLTQCEKPEKDDDWTEITREAMLAKFTELKGARIGTIKREEDGTVWTKSGVDKWETFGTRQHGESTDDFGLAERIVCD